MMATKLVAAALSVSMLAPPAPEPEARDSAVESVFDMGLDEPPPPPPEPRTDTEEPQSVFDMGLDEAPSPPPTAAPAVTTAPVAPRPSTLRQAGWGTLIGGFALASFAGMSLGIAERERNRTRRISLAYDLYGTSPRPLHEDIAKVLEASKRNRVRFTLISAGLAASAAVTLIVSGVMLGVARKRRRQARVQASLGTLRF